MQQAIEPATTTKTPGSTLIRLLLATGSGVVVGVVGCVTAISLAAIAYSGDIENIAGIGVITTLLGMAAAAVVGALTLTYRGTVLGAQDITAVTLSVAASALFAQWSGVSDERLFATIATMMAISTALTGIFFIFLGYLRIGNVARYVPYPVIGGFLAATGALLVLAAIGLSTGRTVGVFDLPATVVEVDPIRWAPSLALAFAFFAVSRLSDHPGALTGFLGVALIGFYAVLFLTGTSIDEARALGLLLGSPGSEAAGSLSALTLPVLLPQADYGAILAQAPKLVTVCVLAAIGMVMGASGLEHITKHEFDINRDFRGTGLGNMASALFGGLPVYHYFGASTLAHALHLRSAAAGFCVAAVCLVLVFAGSSLLESLPLCVLAGLSGFIGLSLLHEWIIEKRRTMPLVEYAVVILILAVMVGVGFLEGVATGLVACVGIFVFRSAGQDVVLKTFDSTARQSMVDRGPQERRTLLRIGNRNRVFELQGHLFFGTANRLYRDVTAFLSQHETATIVLDFRRVHSIDSSAVHSFQKLAEHCARNDTQMVVTGLPDHLRATPSLEAVVNAGATVVFGEVDEGMEWAEDQLLEGVASTSNVPPNAGFFEIFATSAAHYASRRSLKAGEKLVEAGEVPDGYYMVEDGRLTVTIPTFDGKSFRIRSVGPGALIGEVGHYTGKARTATVEAVTQCTVLHVSQAGLDRMEQDEPKAASALHKLAAQYLATRLTENTLLVDHNR
ncbi:MAG: SulP family inorganic anion transporter [Pseudomonadota bacterium]